MSFKGLTIEQICEGVLSDEIKVDMKGHNSLTLSEVHENSHSFLPEIANVKKHFIPKWLNDKKRNDNYRNTREIEPDLKKFYERENGPKAIGEWLNTLGVSVSYTCHDCGAELKPILINENTLSFVSSKEFHSLNEKNKKGVIIDVSKISDCPIGQLGIKDMIKTYINLPTGKLLFANIFREGTIIDIAEKSVKIGLSSLLGRIEIAETLSKIDVGMAQMSNMSINIWRRKDGKEILITDMYTIADDEDEELTYDGYDKIGHIHLGVWRWMCADLKILEKHKEPTPINLKLNETVEYKNRNYTLADVKPGKWCIEHYYDVVGDRKDGIYSKLYLDGI